MLHKDAWAHLILTSLYLPLPFPNNTTTTHTHTHTHTYTHTHAHTLVTTSLLFMSLLHFFKLIFTGVLLIYSVVLVSAIQKSEPVLHIHTATLFLDSFPIYRVLSRGPCAIQQVCISGVSMPIPIFFFFTFSRKASFLDFPSVWISCVGYLASSSGPGSITAFLLISRRNIFVTSA